MKILIVSAHPDDESIGAGGTLLKHAAAGDGINWLIITRAFQDQGYSAEFIANRENEIKVVAKKLSVNNIYNLDYPTSTLHYSLLPELISRISAIFKILEPEVIYVPNHSDIHSDHRFTFEAVIACTKSFRCPTVKKILMYECLSETEFAPLSEMAFSPDYFVDISQYLKRKLDLVSVYSSEIGEHPFPRSLRNIEALAVYRGATSGVEYAEAFRLVKYIDK